MLCSLLRVFKVFFVGNGLFSSRAMVHLDRNFSTAAITYHLEHDALHIDHTVTLVQDARYHRCFMDHPHTVTDHYLFLGPELKEKLHRIEEMARDVPCSPSSLPVYPQRIPSKTAEDNKPVMGSSPFIPSSSMISSGDTVIQPVDKKKDLIEISGFPSRRPLLTPTPTISRVPTGQPSAVPLWIHTGRLSEHILPHHASSGNHTSTRNHTAPSGNHTAPSGNQTSWNTTSKSIHPTPGVHPTELILESNPAHSFPLRNESDHGHRIDDGNASPGDSDRISSVSDSEEED